jgi:hypothetical protein
MTQVQLKTLISDGLKKFVDSWNRRFKKMIDYFAKLDI